MHRGHRRMRHRPEVPGWTGRAHYGVRHRHGCCHHEVTPHEEGCECHGTRHQHGCCHHEATAYEEGCECHGTRHQHDCCHHEATAYEEGCECHGAQAQHREGCCHHEATPCGCESSQWATTAEGEREFLEDQAEVLRRHLARIERRISELEPHEA